MPKRREKQMTRFLLPCTSGVEMDALEALVHLAADQRATLMPLSLIPQPLGKHQRVDLELLLQSQDFLVAVQSRAAHYQVPLEPAEVLTRALVQSILASISTHHCDALLFAARFHRGCPLPLEVVEHLLRARPCPPFVVHFPSTLRGRWLQRRAKGQADMPIGGWETKTSRRSKEISHLRHRCPFRCQSHCWRQNRTNGKRQFEWEYPREALHSPHFSHYHHEQEKDISYESA